MLPESLLDSHIPVAQAANTEDSYETNVFIYIADHEVDMTTETPAVTSQMTGRDIFSSVDTNFQGQQPGFEALILTAQINIANNLWSPEQGAAFITSFIGGGPEEQAELLSELMAQSPAFKGHALDEPAFQSALDAPLSQFSYDEASNSFRVDFTMPMKPVDTHMKITYKTSDGSALPASTFTDTGITLANGIGTKVVTGFSGQTYTDTRHALIPEVPGYTASANSITFNNNDDPDKEQNVTITYRRPAPAFQTFQVYGKQKLYRYQHVDFKKSERIRKYATKPSAYAPVFTVVNTTQSKAGNPRYQLSDGSYITAKSAYVGKLFLGDETAKTLYVTSPKGIWTHTDTAFSDQLTHLKQGSKVTVTKLVRDRSTTRYQLADGTFVTGNQRYVTTAKPQWVTRVKAKGGRNLYSDVTLIHRLKHYRKGHIFNVTGWDYSYGHNQLISGTKRYKVAGGYITGNPKLVKIVD
ncbi:hypothetical protein IV54_GL000760 [Levilactobacillus paucivorans]|uniref:DUF5776 domain-containing protein n=1 Tax=Levilactobacillus paucivorans TaxID=616990 RepID=A0A0R2LUK5_9LACO|nr:hypothetical protein IV54_GL000760 [Levilactobacillus paucivorans]